MSIPANVILGGDLDTIGRLRSGRFDDPFMPSLDRPYGEGLLLVIPPYKKSGSVTYDVPLDMELHRVHFDTNKYTTEDDWSLYLNEDTYVNYIVKDSSQKNYTEGLQLMSVVKLKKGDKLTFKLKNTSFGTGIRAEISMSFLVSSSDMKGQSSPSNGEVTKITGVHVSYNLFTSKEGNPIYGTSLYDEAVPFLIKEGKDYYKVLKMTGTHEDLAPESKYVKSATHNLPRTVKIYYDKGDGTVEAVQLKKNFIYVSVPDEIYSVAADKASYLGNIEELLKPYDGLKDIPFRVRGIKESNMKRVTKITIT